MAEISDSDLADIREQLLLRRTELLTGWQPTKHSALLGLGKLERLLEQLPDPGVRFDRKAYQRDLMRQRRAEGKA